jgi:hypothetical protein
MNEQVEKPKENVVAPNTQATQTVASPIGQFKDNSRSSFGLTDSGLAGVSQLMAMGMGDNRPIMRVEDKRDSSGFQDNRNANKYQDTAKKAAPRADESLHTPYTLAQLKKKFASLDVSEAAQLRADTIDYKVSYAEELPQLVGVEGSQQPLENIAQLKEMGIHGYIANTDKEVASPIIQMVRTPEGFQTQIYTGSQVVVTQMHVGHTIWKGIKDAGAVAVKYSTSLLLATESILTISAGIVACSINPFAGAGAIIIGILKGVRAFFAFLDVHRENEDPADKAQRKVWANSIRSVEAGLALIFAIVGLPSPAASDWTKATAVIFASVKSLRSLLMLCGADKYTMGKKLIQGLQLVEGASILTGGFAMLAGPEATGAHKAIGGLGTVIGASKGVRGAEGMHGAMTEDNVPVDLEEIANSDLMQGIAAMDPSMMGQMP